MFKSIYSMYILFNDCTNLTLKHFVTKHCVTVSHIVIHYLILMSFNDILIPER